MEILVGGSILINHKQLGEGQDIIFLHGWGGSIASFYGAGQSLSKCFRVTLVDFYGFGNTIHPDSPLNLDDYVNSIVNIINHYRMQNVLLVGHSFGGRVAIKLAQKYGHLVGKIVLCDSAGIIPKRRIKYYFKVYLHKLLRKLGFNHAGGSKDYKSLNSVMKQTFKNIVNEDLTALTKKVTAPTMIIWGDKDKETPIYMAKMLHKNIPNSGLVIFKNCGHFAYIERQDIFYAILIKFFLEGEDGVSNSYNNNYNKHNSVIKIPRIKSK